MTCYGEDEFCGVTEELIDATEKLVKKYTKKAIATQKVIDADDRNPPYNPKDKDFIRAFTYYTIYVVREALNGLHRQMEEERQKEIQEGKDYVSELSKGVCSRLLGGEKRE